MLLDEKQVLSFRARRGHLMGPGAPSPAAAARAVIGIQAQVESAGFWSVAMRTAGRPSAADISRELLEARRLIRTWAQRDTLHFYAADDWPLITAADPLWPMTGRRGAIPPEHVLDAARERMGRGVLTRGDVLDLPTAEMLEEMAARTGEEQAARYAAGRLFWRLAHQGEVCFAGSVGAENGYVLRSHWLPDLEFPVHDPVDAAVELTRRYLRVNGPATAQDVGHYFGANVSKTKEWLARLGPELTPVTCGSRKGLVALSEDLEDLANGGAAPPPRLLAAFDTLLMSHADKTWTVPDPAENKAIWRASAIVAAVVLAGGRAVAVWTQKKTKKALQVAIEPLAGWKAEYLPRLEPDAGDLAAHLGLPRAELAMA